MIDRQPTATEQREAADVLQRLLDKVEAGELTAPAGMLRQMQGAIITLKATVKASR
jgi:hypothetical protein